MTRETAFRSAGFANPTLRKGNSKIIDLSIQIRIILNDFA